MFVDGFPGSFDREVFLNRLDDLPRSIREALVLVRHQGLTFEETASRLGIQPDEVCLLIARALEYLMATVPVLGTKLSS